MKQIFITLAMLLTLSGNAMASGQNHRHHAVATAVTPAKNDTVKTEKEAVATPANTAKSDEIEAFSDTTGIEENDSVAEEYTPNYNNDDSDMSENDYRILEKVLGGTVGVGGIILAIVVILLVFLLLFSPIIVIILVLRYLIKRHNDRVNLAEKAMMTGQPMPEAAKPVDNSTPNHKWETGVRNASIGVGLMILFWLAGAEQIVGVGALVLCIGLGQMYIARHNSNNINNFYNDQMQSRHEEPHNDVRPNPDDEASRTPRKNPNDDLKF